MESIWQDIRYACRSLTKSPALSLTIILSLALAIGMNTAVFSLLNEVLLNPPPFKDSERIVWLNENYNVVNYETVEAFSDAFTQGPFFENIAGLRPQAFWITNGITPEKVIGIRLAGNPLRLLGIQPAIGRFFRNDENRAGAPIVAMISYDCWQKRFGGDPNVTGKNIRIDGTTATIIGVLPKLLDGVFFGEEIWLPMSALHEHKLKRFRTVYLMGKLKSERTIKQAQDWINSIAKNMGARQDHRFELQTIRDMKYEIEKGAIPVLWVWMGVAGFILLIASANIMSLLLARSASREKEFAIRTTLGASRFELIRLQLTESLLLSFLGGIAGLFIALWAKDFFGDASQFPDIWGFSKISASMNWIVLLFTGVISVVAGIVSGVLPAILFTRRNLNSSLKEGGQYSSTDLPRRKAGSALVVVELSLAVIVVTGAGLLIKGLLLLMSVDPGIQTRNILTMDVQLPPYKYAETGRGEPFYDELLERIRNIPGVELASSVLWLPSTGSSDGEVALDDSSETWVDTNYQAVAPDYFHLMGIGLVQGRVFAQNDRANSPLVAVVSESFAKRFFPGQNPLGKRLRFDAGEINEGMKEIIGVVRDVHQSGLDQQKQPLIYVPFSQSSIFWRQIVVRTTIPFGTMAALMRKQVWEIDPDQPVGSIETMDQVVSKSIADRRLKTLLLSTLGITGLLISMIGVYGLISYSVACRTHEMGIRMAIGAQKRDILKLVTRQGAFLAIAGLAIGVAGAMALTRFLSGIIYGISPTDPQTFVIVCVLFLFAAILASYIPARRAARVDPIVALRHE